MNDEFVKYDAFAKHMEKQFPKMFGGKYGGFACGEGWWPIIETLCSNIQHHIDWKNKAAEVVPQVTVAQIKEKLGGLRFYYDGGDDEIRGMVRMAEAWADKSCETCGAPGKRRYGVWIKTLCDHHAAERDAARAEYMKSNGLEE
jgi:hypothetical protein